MGVAKDSYPRDGSTYSFVVGFAETLVEYHRHIIGGPDRRDRTGVAVSEQGFGLVFGGEAKPLVQYVLQCA